MNNRQIRMWGPCVSGGIKAEMSSEGLLTLKRSKGPIIPHPSSSMHHCAGYEAHSGGLSILVSSWLLVGGWDGYSGTLNIEMVKDEDEDN